MLVSSMTHRCPRSNLINLFSFKSCHDLSESLKIVSTWMRTSSKARQTIKHLMMRLTWKMPPKGHLANNGQLPEENSIEEGTFKNEWKTQKPGNLVNLGHQFYQHSSRSLNKLIYFIKETKTSLVFYTDCMRFFNKLHPMNLWPEKFSGVLLFPEMRCVFQAKARQFTHSNKDFYIMSHMEVEHIRWSIRSCGCLRDNYLTAK